MKPSSRAIPCLAYTHAFLPDYIEEKTHARIRAEQVERFSLDDVRNGCLDRLMALTGNVACAVDAESYEDLSAFARDLNAAAKQGKRFLCRSAAGIVSALAALPPQPIAANDMRQYVRNAQPGAVLVGSHVSKTTRQLQQLLKQPDVAPVEVDVSRLQKESSILLKEVIERIRVVHAQGFDAGDIHQSQRTCIRR